MSPDDLEARAARYGDNAVALQRRGSVAAATQAYATHEHLRFLAATARAKTIDPTGEAAA